MSLSTRGKRTIDVNGRRFLWHVAPDSTDHHTPILRISAVDRRLYAQISLAESSLPRTIAVSGVPAGTRRTRRFFAPRDWSYQATPALVRHVVEWCEDDGPKMGVDSSG